MKAYKVLGTTNDVTDCELCGRQDLKGTIVLAPLDVDGNPGDPVYFGSDCGARAAGWTQKEIRRAARVADRERREAEDMERCRKQVEESQARENTYREWLRTMFGTDDQLQAYKVGGFSSVVRLRCHYWDLIGD